MADGAGPANPSVKALSGLLALQSRIGRAAAGAVMAADDAGELELLAVFPRREKSKVDWLSVVKPHAPKLGQLNQATVIPLLDEQGRAYGHGVGAHVVMLAAGADGAGRRRIQAFLVDTSDARDLDYRRQLLELSRTLLDLQSAQTAAAQSAEKARRMAQVVEDISAMGEIGRFRGLAMALCNQLCTRLQAERVSVGMASRPYVKLAAMSQTEHVNRRMQLVQDIEAAMEECLDQDVEAIFPTLPEVPVVTRAAAELSKKHGPSCVLTLPLRNRKGEPVAAVTVERAADRPFDTEQIRTGRLLCNLVTPRLLELHEHDRWFGSRWAHAVKNSAGTLVGPEHTWAKLAAVGLVALAAFLVLARGTDRVEGTFVVEPVEARSVPAPWDGYLEDVSVEPGDVVTAGVTVLGRLDTSELRMQLAQAKADEAKALTEADVAWREDKQAERLIALARAKQSAAQVNLLEHRLAQATMLAPLSGVVTQGDLKKEQGRPVEKGQVLFEVAPLEALRAVMMVPEDRIFDVWEGQRGELATASHPGHKLPFVVEHVYPVAEVANQKNVFRVRVKLEPAAGQTVDGYWLKPGVEGVAKADAGEASYAWLWTRDAVNWVRMKLWW